MRIELYNKRINYTVEFKSQVTVIRGSSGTGKTNMINMLREYIDCGRMSGIGFKSDIFIDNIVVLDVKSDEYLYSLNYRNKLYFADEHVSFVRSKRFLQYLKESGSYLVYISRSSQIDADEICEFKCEKSGNVYLNRLETCVML